MLNWFITSRKRWLMGHRPLEVLMTTVKRLTILPVNSAFPALSFLTRFIQTPHGIVIPGKQSKKMKTARQSEPAVTLGTRWNIPLFTRYVGLRKFRLQGKQLRTHKYTIGLSEQGKSYLLAQSATELLLSGCAFALIDPHQDLAHDTLRLIYEAGYFNRPDAYNKLWYVDF